MSPTVLLPKLTLVISLVMPRVTLLTVPSTLALRLVTSLSAAPRVLRKEWQPLITPVRLELDVVVTLVTVPIELPSLLVKSVTILSKLLTLVVCLARSLRPRPQPL